MHYVNNQLGDKNVRIEIDTTRDSAEEIRAIGRILAEYGITEPVIDDTVLVGGERESITGDNPQPNRPRNPIPPPPPPTVTTEPVPLQPATTSEDSEELDDNGIAWDVRIHATTKTKTKDGKWKYKRSLDENVRQEVEEELKGAAPTPSAPATTEIGPSQIIARVSELRALDKLTDIQLEAICASCGIESVAFIMGQDDEICAKFSDLLENTPL